MRTNDTTALLATALLALPLALACGDKDADTGDDTGGGSADGGSSADGGTADGGSSDGGASGDYFEPTQLLLTWQVGFIDGEQGTVLYGGGGLSNIVAFFLVDDTWTSFHDTSGFCSLTYDLAGATPVTSCTDCFPGAAWQVDGWTLLASEGECADLDPSVYPDVEAWLQGYTWRVGFGEISTSVESAILGSYPQFSGSLVGGYVDTDFGGSSGWSELNWAYAYAITAGGELDQTTYVAQGGGPGGLPDGYYVSSPLYPFPL